MTAIILSDKIELNLEDVYILKTYKPSKIHKITETEGVSATLREQCLSGFYPILVSQDVLNLKEH